MLSPMARGRRRGPLLLRFRALLVSLNLHAAKVVDTRQASKVRYSLQDCYVCAFALFYLQDPSVLEFQRRFQDELRTNNLNSTFGVAQIPADSQFRDLLDSHDYEPLLGCFGDWIVFPASRRFQTVPSRVASACQAVMLVSASGERQRRTPAVPAVAV